MNKEDYKIAYENVMIANRMLEQENKQLKEDKKKAIELIRKAMVESDITGNGTLNLNELLEILGDKENE